MQSLPKIGHTTQNFFIPIIKNENIINADMLPILQLTPRDEELRHQSQISDIEQEGLARFRSIE
jgi:hypothetical protein